MAESCNTHPVPGAWYDLSARVSHAIAVNDQIPDCLPMGPEMLPVMREVNEVGYLAGAVSDILALIEKDVERLYDELNDREKLRRAA